MLAELNYTSPKTGRTFTRAVPVTAYCYTNGVIVDHANLSDSDRRFMDLYYSQSNEQLYNWATELNA